jgi:hypothetical protein
MSADKKETICEIIPGVGWGNVKLGDSAEQVHEALQTAGLAYENSYDGFEWELDEPSCVLTFAAGEPKRLVQIACGDFSTLVYGARVVGLPLPPALVNLGLTSFDDTLWSFVDYDVEFKRGVMIDDAERPRQATTEELLNGGTLWVLSLGLGLSCYRGRVDSLLVRDPAHVPRVGCGSITPEVITFASDPQTYHKLAPPEPQPTIRAPRVAPQPVSRTVKILLALVGVVLMVIPIYLVYTEMQRWSHAVSVVGKVVAVEPEMFPDIITFEYPLPNQELARVEVKFNYTNVRQIGEEAELLYLPDNPHRAITRIALGDAMWDTYSPMWLFGSFCLGAFLLKLRL